MSAMENFIHRGKYLTPPCSLWIWCWDSGTFLLAALSFQGLTWFGLANLLLDLLLPAHQNLPPFLPLPCRPLVCRKLAQPERRLQEQIERTSWPQTGLSDKLHCCSLPNVVSHLSLLSDHTCDRQPENKYLWFRNVWLHNKLKFIHFFLKTFITEHKKCPLNLDRVHIVSSCDQMKPLEIRDACVPKIGWIFGKLSIKKFVADFCYHKL